MRNEIMHIIVPIKQVPGTDNVTMDPDTGTMVRSGVEAVVNPLDVYALEAALRLAERHGGRVTAVTMGPPPAETVLREALAMGCADAVLASDRAFGGVDTWATSYTLAQVIRSLAPFDLVIAGERATDGDTAQVGPGIAAWLDLPPATYVTAIEEQTDSGSITVQRLTEEGYQRLCLPLPALLTVVKEIAVPRLPTFRGKLRAKDAPIRRVTADDAQIDRARTGLKGSPTRVVKIETPKVTRGGRVLRTDGAGGVAAVVDAVIAFLAARGIVSAPVAAVPRADDQPQEER